MRIIGWVISDAGGNYDVDARSLWTDRRAAERHMASEGLWDRGYALGAVFEDGSVTFET